jgi:triosephosphate isomerase (TIM)
MIYEPSFLYVANWKMKLSFEQSQSFITDHKADFERLAQVIREKKIVICPSHEALFSVAQVVHGSGVLLGAQDCSRHRMGSYTGEVAALSLSQLGCHFCIIGHSERRQQCGETDEQIAEKFERLIEVGITPIFCVGETFEHYEQQKTINVIDRQITEIFRDRRYENYNSRICIAYEPVWAIGTGKVAGRDHIDKVLRHITILMHELNVPCKISLLYGGSLDVENARELKSIHGLGGFLIGGASIDFQKFEKIVT